MYWQYAYVPPAASTFSATGSKQPTRPDGQASRSGVSMLPNESLDQSPMSMVDKARQMGFKVPKTGPAGKADSRKPSSDFSNAAMRQQPEKRGGVSIDGVSQPMQSVPSAAKVYFLELFKTFMVKILILTYF